MGVRTQDLIFTLYGEYLQYRGGEAWIGSLIELLGTLDVSAQAVRSTTSRMARKGWLTSEKRGRNSFYALTPKAIHLLSEGAEQIFHSPPNGWDGNWYLVTYGFTDDLTAVRHQLRKRLAWLGFGQLANGTLISPRDRRQEVQAILDDLDAHAYTDYFRAQPIQFDRAPAFASRCWDLAAMSERYQDFIQKYQPQFEQDQRQASNGQAPDLAHYFRRRFWLIHEYRYFPFSDPYLPASLLPEDWPGETAVVLFQQYHTWLEARANAYVDEVLARSPF